MISSLRHAFRSLAKSPGFSAVVILIAALGIGANTAIFSVVRAVLLRPLPLQEPDRLVRLRENFAQDGGDETQLNLAPITWQRWRQYNTVFTDIGMGTGGSLTLTAPGQPAQYFAAARVSFNFLDVLGVRPALGRNFLEADDQPGAPRTVLVSHAFWRGQLGGRPDAIGQSINLDGVPHTILGVMPPNFRHPYRAELWVPLALRIDPGAPTGHYLYAPARLKPGVTLEQARTAMRELCTRLAREYPGPDNARAAWVMPLHRTFTDDEQPMLLAITGAAALVLLIAGANIASLLLARYLERERETAVRAALGASRWRLTTDLLAQSLLLALAGCGVGVLLAAWLIGPLTALSPMASDNTGSALREFDFTVGLDGPVLLLSVGLTLLVGLGFGLLPALRGGRGDLSLAHQSGGRGATVGRGTRRLLGTLVIVEIAVAVVLLVATGLMLKSFDHLVNEPWGFDVKNRLTFNVTFSPRLRPEHADRVAYIDQALARLRALPGVISATATTPDLVSFGRNLAAVTPQGSTPPEARGYFLVNHRLAVPGYFRAAGIPIVRGRAIDETDLPGGQKVAVVSESFAKHFWPGADPIGKTIKRGRANDPRPPFLVVGVFAEVKGLTDSTDGDLPGLWYLPYAQNPNYLTDDVVFVVHSQQAPDTLTAAVRTELARIDPNIATYGFSTLERQADDTYVEARFALLLVNAFGALGLLLSALGLYGLLSFEVAGRTREIGVRTALGAARRDIFALVFRGGGTLVLAGLALGCVAAFPIARLIQSQLHGVGAGDPLAYLAAATVLSLAAALACWLPARRATKVDPMVALRAE